MDIFATIGIVGPISCIAVAAFLVWYSEIRPAPEAGEDVDERVIRSVTMPMALAILLGSLSNLLDQVSLPGLLPVALFGALLAGLVAVAVWSVIKMRQPILRGRKIGYAVLLVAMVTSGTGAAEIASDFAQGCLAIVKSGVMA